MRIRIVLEMDLLDANEQLLTDWGAASNVADNIAKGIREAVFGAGMLPPDVMADNWTVTPHVDV